MARVDRLVAWAEDAIWRKQEEAQLQNWYEQRERRMQHWQAIYDAPMRATARTTNFTNLGVTGDVLTGDHLRRAAGLRLKNGDYYED